MKFPFYFQRSAQISYERKQRFDFVNADEAKKNKLQMCNTT